VIGLNIRSSSFLDGGVPCSSTALIRENANVSQMLSPPTGSSSVSSEVDWRARSGYPDHTW